MDTGYEFVAARSKRVPEDDAPPVQQPMRPVGDIRRNPSTDQKKTRTQMARSRKTAAMSVQDREFLIQHARAYGGPEYADWYMETYGNDADSLDDVPDHPHVQREFMEWRDAQPLDPAESSHRTATKEPAMTDAAEQPLTEAELLNRMAKAHPVEAARYAQQLEALRSQSRLRAQAAREVGFATDLVETMLPTVAVPRSLHTAGTDWIGDERTEGFDVTAMTRGMVAEASAWFSRLHPLVIANHEEYAIQATGMARRYAGQYGADAEVAVRAFLDHANHLRRRHAGTNPNDQSGNAESGLPVGVSNDEVAFSETGWEGGNSGREHETKPSDTPSLAEGDQPEGGQAPQLENPEADKTHNESGVGDAGTVTQRNDIDGETKPAFSETGWEKKRGSLFVVAAGRCAECGHDHFFGPGIGYGECPVQECGCEGQPWAKEIGPFPQVREASKTASTYCPAHGVYVGKGNQEQHDHCKTEQRETKDSAKVAGGDHAVCNACGWEGDESAVVGDRCPKCRQDEVNYYFPGGGSPRTAADEGGTKCSVCGHPIERDPAGEEPRTWHHSDGDKHDHEAKPGGEEKTAATYPGFYRTVTHPDGTTSLEWVPEWPKSPDTVEKERLFPDGIPLHGDLTPEQQAWLKRRGSLGAEPTTMAFLSRLRTTLGEQVDPNGDYDKSTGGTLADGWEDGKPQKKDDDEPVEHTGGLSNRFFARVHANLAAQG